MNKLLHPPVRTAIRLGLGLILAFAAVAKLTHLSAFVQSFAVLPYLSGTGWRPLAMLLPAAELVVGLRLILSGDDEEAAGASLLMFSVFFVYQLAVAYQTGLTGRPVNNCPCFTFGSTATSPQYVYVLRNAGFLGLALAGLYPRRPGRDGVKP